MARRGIDQIGRWRRGEGGDGRKGEEGKKDWPVLWIPRDRVNTMGLTLYRARG